MKASLFQEKACLSLTSVVVVVVIIPPPNVQDKFACFKHCSSLGQSLKQVQWCSSTLQKVVPFQDNRKSQCFRIGVQEAIFVVDQICHLSEYTRVQIGSVSMVS